MRHTGDHSPPNAIVATVRRRNGLQYAITVDRRARDPISLTYASGCGDRVSASLVDLMLALVTPGDLVLDLGAHIGTFSLAAAAAGCQVIAVEASERNAALLESSAVRNGFRDLRVVHAAVSDRTGYGMFLERGPWGHLAAPPSPGVSRVRTRRADGSLDRLVRARLSPGDAVRVRLRRVDDLVGANERRRVAFVKMDLEGCEADALTGMRRLLAGSNRPPLLYESNGHCLAWSDRTPDGLVAAVDELGYRSYRVSGRTLVRTRGDAIQARTVVDCLAVKGRLHRLAGWRTRASSRRMTIVELAREARHPHPHHRAYAAAALSRCSVRMLSAPALRRALVALARDDDRAVRAAVRWWSP